MIVSQKIKKIFILIVPFVWAVIMSITIYDLYLRIPNTSANLNTGNMAVVKDYFVTGTDGNVSKHVYIICDKDTKLMYLNIDTIQDGKIVASSQSELYNKNQSIMTYKDFLNDPELTAETQMNNKVQVGDTANEKK